MIESVVLAWARAYARQVGQVPTLREIEQAVGFRQQGGVRRLLEAVQAVAEEEITVRRAVR